MSNLRFRRVTLIELMIVTALLAVPALTFAQNNAGTDIASKKVTLNVEDADIRAALKLLFKSAGANYTIDQSVAGTATVSLTDVPFGTALESLLKSTQSQKPLTYRIENGVYFISPKAEIPPQIPSDPPDTAPDRPRRRMEKITLNFVDVETIIQAFGGTILTSRFGGTIGGVVDGSGPLGVSGQFGGNSPGNRGLGSTGRGAGGGTGNAIPGGNNGGGVFVGGSNGRP